MSKNFVNRVNISGYLFSHNLTERVSQSGATYYRGTIQVATDEDAINVVKVNVPFLAGREKKKDGSENANFAALKSIVEDATTYEAAGKEATKIRIDGYAGVNDFVDREGNMASPKEIQASFIHLNDAREFGATFDIDVLLARCVERDFDDQDSVVTVSGYTWNFFKEISPIDFTVRVPGGKSYFLDKDLSSSNPLLTEVKGNIVSSTIVREIEEESAFGDPIVRKTTRSVRSWDIEWAKPEPYDWDDEATLTKKELKEMLAAREEHLAEVKQRNAEYLASRNGNAGFPESKPAAKEVAKVVFDEEDDSDMDSFPF